MKKRVLSLLLVLLMVVSMASMSALADRGYTDVAYAVEGGNIYFDKSTGTITGCDESVTKASIPSEIDGVKVTSIGGGVFIECTGLENIDIPNGVTKIPFVAFLGCTGLTSVTIPSSVTSFGNHSFDKCISLEDVYYLGSEAQWNEISNNNVFVNSPNLTIHYNWHTHSYTAVVTPPTCTEQGCTTYTCSCGDSYVEDYVGALGHKTELANAKEATCTEAGYTGDEICTVCGETISQGEEIEPTGHHYKGNTCVDCGEQRSTGDTIRAWFRDTAQQIKSFFDKIFGRN